MRRYVGVCIGFSIMTSSSVVFAEDATNHRSFSLGLVANGVAAVNPSEHAVMPEGLMLLESELSMNSRLGLLIGFGAGAAWPHGGHSLFLGAHRGGVRVHVYGRHYADLVYALDSLYTVGGPLTEFALGAELKYVCYLPRHTFFTVGANPSHGIVKSGPEHSGFRLGLLIGVGFDFLHIPY